MTALVLELKEGEVMIVNGATIRFKTRTRLELNTHARFLFGKQIMPETQATTPAKRLYHEIQTVYIGCDANRAVALPRACALIAQLRTEMSSLMAKEILDRMLAFLHADQCYEALRFARQVIRHEESQLLHGLAN